MNCPDMCAGHFHAMNPNCFKLHNEEPEGYKKGGGKTRITDRSIHGPATYVKAAIHPVHQSVHQFRGENAPHSLTYIDPPGCGFAVDIKL